MKKKTILVTGGAGYIGSHVNKNLSRAGYDTVVIDNLSNSFPPCTLCGKFYRGDLGSAVELDAVFSEQKIDAVVHLASLVSIGESSRTPADYYRNNVSYTLLLLEAMLRHNVRKMIFSSSAAVYGIPSKVPIPESHPLQPINPYGETKRAVEAMLKDFDTAYSLRYCSLRYFNAAGADPEGELVGSKIKETNLIPIILQNLANGNNSIKIFGTDYPTPDGTCIRDYVHVQDLSNAHLLALESLLDGSPSAVYNLGNGKAHSVKEIIQAAERATQQKITVESGERRPGDPPVLLADGTKARHELGWKPAYTDIEIILRHAWQTYAQQAVQS